MEKSLSADQYQEIMNTIWDSHRFGGLSENRNEKCKHIKYIHPVWDMRFGKCFHIVFRGLTGEISFDLRDADESMFDKIMEWLNSPLSEDKK